MKLVTDEAARDHERYVCHAARRIRCATRPP
jgi:hypothetical protein